MAHKAIREADGMRMLARLIKDYSNGKYEISDKVVTVTPQHGYGATVQGKPLAKNRKVGS